MPDAPRILLTGGLGYIGSHTCVALMEAGFEPVILDDLSNARADTLDRLARIAGRRPEFHEGSVLDRGALDRILATGVAGAVHFAARKAVADSVADPLSYAETNLAGLIHLLRAMDDHGTRRLVFSSSATVYGDTPDQPIPETAPRTHANPYGFTKLAGETILDQLSAADPAWAVGVLRYFNPIGAHPSGLIGEDPQGVVANVMPHIERVAAGRAPHLRVFGDDYPTRDGTGERDYIDVMDLAEGHVLSLRRLLETGEGHTVNLGTGRGTTVLELLAAYGRATGLSLPHVVEPRRAGDVAMYVADAARARALLGFETRRTLEDSCRTSWAWVRTQAQHAP
ncbi:UDP-glucose 4-epimerase GalE [Jannaschia sp. Os4]|uniref:UDP-glucose 4-epimerase GalE n=1 Tax=Jannaschia sp. Os4 TaxID=2807617 RepID=UPI00193A8CE3|nr:UDP-glucose 4-epimerase GalE [Jannaschia sp. Os4]MBM2575390.1 UDP-glucose 4-epimerase GalE [Jannaschia sp. Os4]